MQSDRLFWESASIQSINKWCTQKLQKGVFTLNAFS